jgi:hypothetical protein
MFIPDTGMSYYRDMLKPPKAYAKYVVIIGLCVFGVLGWSLFANAPNETRSATSHKKTVPTPRLDLSPLAVNGSFADFTYPAIFSVAPSNAVIAPVVAVYNYRYHTLQTWNLDITIVRVPGGHLLDNDAYKMRTLKPETYQPSSLSVGSQSVPVMSDISVDGYAKVAFLVHGQYQATVSLVGTSVNGTSDLETSLQQVVASWQWQTE